jgi:hypothetical protein
MANPYTQSGATGAAGALAAILSGLSEGKETRRKRRIEDEDRVTDQAYKKAQIDAQNQQNTQRATTETDRELGDLEKRLFDPEYRRAVDPASLQGMLDRYNVLAKSRNKPVLSNAPDVSTPEIHKYIQGVQDNVARLGLTGESAMEYIRSAQIRGKQYFGPDWDRYHKEGKFQEIMPGAQAQTAAAPAVSPAVAQAIPSAAPGVSPGAAAMQRFLNNLDGNSAAATMNKVQGLPLTSQGAATEPISAMMVGNGPSMAEQRPMADRIPGVTPDGQPPANPALAMLAKIPGLTNGQTALDGRTMAEKTGNAPAASSTAQGFYIPQGLSKTDAANYKFLMAQASSDAQRGAVRESVLVKLWKIDQRAGEIPADQAFDKKTALSLYGLPAMTVKQTKDLKNKDEDQKQKQENFETAEAGRRDAREHRARVDESRANIARIRAETAAAKSASKSANGVNSEMKKSQMLTNQRALQDQIKQLEEEKEKLWNITETVADPLTGQTKTVTKNFTTWEKLPASRRPRVKELDVMIKDARTLLKGINSDLGLTSQYAKIPTPGGDKRWSDRGASAKVSWLQREIKAGKGPTAKWSEVDRIVYQKLKDGVPKETLIKTLSGK